jgi:hypothetical protein
MSAGPLSEYAGVTGVADSGGDSLTEDLNVYYSVRARSHRVNLRLLATNMSYHSPAISHGS